MCLIGYFRKGAGMFFSVGNAFIMLSINILSLNIPDPRRGVPAFKQEPLFSLTSTEYLQGQLSAVFLPHLVRTRSSAMMDVSASIKFNEAGF